VLTTTFPGDDVPDDSVRTNLASVAARAGARLSLLRALHESRRQASTDALTGLVNRRALHAAYEEAARVGTGPSVLLCDLDHFKLLNDTHGHEAGDAALVAFADLARSVVRPGDTAARIGGEEFAVLLPDTDVVQAVGVAERLRRAQAESGGRVSTTVSIGVAGPHTGPGLEDRLRQADVALYAAKEAGRDTVVVAGPDGPVLADHDAVYGIMDAMSADDRHHAWRPMSDSGSTRSARSAG
jgi:diguanylate cyclase (GGDEF)-like protein